MTAYAQAPSRSLKIQILSLYAYELPAQKLQTLHEPYGRLSKWQIKRARAHARNNGPGMEMKKNPIPSSLDNTAADGSNGFNTMEQISERLVHLGIDIQWSQSVIKRLHKAKEYLKTDYKVHCQEDDSLCADHCTMFALSDPGDEAFQVKCAHEHTLVCDNCENLKSTLQELENKLKSNTHFSYTQDIKEAANGRPIFSVR
ncbi:Hypothetical predicted protein [Paramuricea clavata]|uniref:Uncharacterized protein n=1 Tax=Paramuricea clavata TaxID=317549 RepID=A0A7D9DIH4_PARCT|nr:Hypothetical predicted protein [Paramuricea clavata]